MEKRIILGSGKLYCTEFSGTIPEDTTLEVDDNLLGLISGGAAIAYESESYTATDDLGLVSKKMITGETVTLETGILTWNGDTLAKVCSTARVTESATDHTRTVKLGGIANYNGKRWLLRFVHDDAEFGKVRITIVGTSEEGFEFTFAKDEETTLDVTFTALPADDDGTLLIYEETDETIVSDSGDTE